MVGITTVENARLGYAAPSTPPKMHNFTYLLSAMAAIGGFLFGYDTGIISAAMLYIDSNRDMQPISNFWKELIVAVTPGFAGIGAVLAAPTADRYGRRPVIMASSVVFVIGAIVCAAAMSKEALVVGRILLGVAIGFASMIVPVYLSESSPVNIRGPALTSFNAMITFGQMAANIIAGFFAFIQPETIGWRLMFGFAAVPAVIQFIGFLYMPESPRWLFRRHGESASEEVLERIYNHDDEWVKFERAEIHSTVEADKLNQQADKSAFRRVLETPHVRHALLVGCSLQMFQQLGGINTIMYYTGEIIKSSGVKDSHTTIWISAVIAGVNFVGTLIPFFLIERCGRRKILIVSAIGVIASLMAMGGAFLLVNRDTASVTTSNVFGDSSLAYFDRCASHSNCDYCVTDDRCGFCTSSSSDNSIAGYCLPVAPLSPDAHSTTGACSTGFNSTSSPTSYTWEHSFCHTKYTFLPIGIMVIYLIFFASGMSPAPWVLNAEFYPLWARSTCVAASTATNWAFNLLISLTFLTLTELITKYGTFFFYAFLTSIGLVVFYFFVPETKNRSLAEIEGLFMSKEIRERYESERKRVMISRGE
uniref:MFS domain-containing protein n=1 Tax=Panagrellus redivivus TaxID=6233 RepID=A0A7E4V885_PANRE